jgi:hypothetical protein
MSSTSLAMRDAVRASCCITLTATSLPAGGEGGRAGQRARVWAGGHGLAAARKLGEQAA